MTCGHCLNAVNKAIANVPGAEVQSVRIGRADLKVTDEAAVERLKAAIGDAGYRVESVTLG